MRRADRHLRLERPSAVTVSPRPDVFAPRRQTKNALHSVTFGDRRPLMLPSMRRPNMTRRLTGEQELRVGRQGAGVDSRGTPLAY